MATFSTSQYSVGEQIWKKTCTSTKESLRIYFTSLPIRLSIHDWEPCKNVIDTEFLTSATRCIIGRFAQPKPLFSLLKATSPLKKKHILDSCTSILLIIYCISVTRSYSCSTRTYDKYLGKINYTITNQNDCALQHTILLRANWFPLCILCKQLPFGRKGKGIKLV